MGLLQGYQLNEIDKFIKYYFLCDNKNRNKIYNDLFKEWSEGKIYF